MTLACLQQESCQVDLDTIPPHSWCFVLVIFHPQPPTLFLGIKSPLIHAVLGMEPSSKLRSLFPNCNHSWVKFRFHALTTVRLWFSLGGREHTCTHACVFSFSQFGCHWSMLKPKYSFPARSPFLLCTHRLTRRQMKPFKYLFTVSSVPIRPCHSCHAPHVSLKHNAINTSSALMDASHMNALMKCVIVSPHRTLTIYLTLWPEAPRSCWKPLAIKWTLSFASMTLSSSLSLKRHSCEKKIQASKDFGAQLQLP